MLKKLKQRKRNKELRLLLGNLREVELRAKWFNSIEELLENIKILKDARDKLYKTILSEDFILNFTSDEKFVIISQGESMGNTIRELKDMEHAFWRVSQEDGLKYEKVKTK